jgi:hypothetical protein
VIGFLVIGCATGKSVPIVIPEEAEEDVAPAAPLQHILVLPFYNLAASYGPNVGLRGPLSFKVFETGMTDPLASDFMTDNLMELLLSNLADRQITLSEALVFDFRRPPGSEFKDEIISALRSAGRQQAADAVMIGFLYDYREREGGAFGVRQPARVAFELNLVGVSSGRLLWHRQFAEIQQPLNEDLLRLPQFLKRGGRWVSVQEIARTALEEMLKTIPKTD